MTTRHIHVHIHRGRVKDAEGPKHDPKNGQFTGGGGGSGGGGKKEERRAPHPHDPSYAAAAERDRPRRERLNAQPISVKHGGETYYKTGKVGEHNSGANVIEYESESGAKRLWRSEKGEVFPD